MPLNVPEVDVTKSQIVFLSPSCGVAPWPIIEENFTYGYSQISHS